MRYYPAFVDMQGQRAVFLGGSGELANKIRLLSKTPAQLDLYGTHIDASVEALISDGKVDWHQRPATLADLEGARFVYVADEDDDHRAALIALANQSGALVNVVDVTRECHFITPALVERGPITIAISSDAKAPALSRHIKGMLERSLPHSLSKVGHLIDGVRGQLKQAFPDTDARRRFLDRFVQGKLGKVESVDQLRSEIDTAVEEATPTGRIAIVGAGPGDAELLTIKAHRYLQEADVIVHDKLVSDDILDLARRDAERIYVGKSRANHTMAQGDICQLLVTLARQGKFVVRLKGGDPFIFGRGGEELDMALEAGVGVEVVPGISAALGCAADAGIPLTHRDHASAVSFVAGQRKDLARQNWHGLAGPGRTLVVYMGLASSADITAKLRADGVAPDMPVAILENGTRSDSRTLHTDLANMAALIAAEQVESPALLVIGDVAAADRQSRLQETLADIVPLKRMVGGQS
jgi:uroporphyrin-III C-methyltransferase/precorrin-2 dehydrogenase/sirohydrochlorin ferrochelatase